MKRERIDKTMSLEIDTPRYCGPGLLSRILVHGIFGTDPVYGRIIDHEEQTCPWFWYDSGPIPTEAWRQAAAANHGDVRGRHRYWTRTASRLRV